MGQRALVSRVSLAVLAGLAGLGAHGAPPAPARLAPEFRSALPGPARVEQLDKFTLEWRRGQWRSETWRGRGTVDLPELRLPGGKAAAANAALEAWAAFPPELDTLKPGEAMEVEKRVEVAMAREGILSLRLVTFFNQYHAAHPWQELAALNLDASGRLLTYQEVFLSGPATRKALETAVAAGLARLTGVAGFPFEGLKDPDRFLILPEGIAFVFSRGEAAPMSAGCPEILLTWDQLRGHLKPNGALALAWRPVPAS